MTLVKPKLEAHVLGRILDTAKGVLNAGSNAVKTVEGGLADLKSGNIRGLISRGLDLFNLDRPSDVDSGQMNCLNTISPPAHMIGMDKSTRLGATATGAYLETDFSSAPASDHLIKSAITKPMLVQTVTWSTTNGEGYNLLTIPVTPGLCRYETVSGSGITPYIKEYNTFLSMFSHFFEFWRGGIEFTLEFAATRFHTGRVMVAFEPNASTQPLAGVGTTITDFSNNPHMVFDLQESKTVTFSVPYVSTTPRKRCVPGQWAAANPRDADMLGWLYVLVFSPLATAENVASSIEMNLYVAASDDFRFYGPRIRASTSLPSDRRRQVPPGPLEVHGGQGDTVSRQTQESVPLIKVGKVIEAPDYFNEPITDVRDLCRRYNCVSDLKIQLTPQAEDPSIMSAVIRLGAHPDTSEVLQFAGLTGNYVSGFASYICRMYALWRGSMRLKIVPLVSRVDRLQMRAIYTFEENPPASVDNSYTNYPLDLQNMCQQSALQLELPFYSRFTQNLCNNVSGHPDFDIYSPGTLSTYVETYPNEFLNDILRITVMSACGGR